MNSIINQSPKWFHIILIQNLDIKNEYTPRQQRIFDQRKNFI
jgi:hypothetical protein